MNIICTVMICVTCCSLAEFICYANYGTICFANLVFLFISEGMQEASELR